jgi:drug/metabolite transporter (DMT)-like permease
MPLTSRRERVLGVFLIVLSAFGYGSGALFAKPIYATGVDWMVLSAWRFLFAAIASWAWLMLWSSQRSALRSLPRRRVLILIGLGVFFIGNSGTYFAGLETVQASLAALIVYIYPAIVAVITIRYGRRLQGRRAWGALALAISGVALAVGGIDPSAAPPLIGIVLIIASPIIYAVWIVLAARFGGERGESDVVDIPPHEAEAPADTPPAEAAPTAAIMITATAISWWVLALGTSRAVLPSQIPAEAWIPLIGVGVVSTALALQTFYAGARRIGAAQASLVSTVEPIYTIVLAAILFGERLTPVQLLGGAMVIMGVVIAQTGSGEPNGAEPTNAQAPDATRSE